MIISNTVLKLNIKGSGDSLVWLFSDPTIEDSKVESLLPSIKDGVYGPNLAYVSRRLSKKTLFIATTSAWKSEDEYGRKGILLSQGLLINGDFTGSSAVTNVCNSFAVLLKIHQLRHQTLGDLLRHLATQGNTKEARKIAVEIFDSVSKDQGNYESQPVLPLANHLKAMLGEHNTRLRVTTKFPWSDELGFFALIGLQSLSEEIQSVAGGPLISSGSYQHISTSEDIPGFRYIDLNQFLTPQIKSNLGSAVRKSGKKAETFARRGSLFESIKKAEESESGEDLQHRTNPWRKLSLLNTPLFSAFLVLCLGVSLMFQQKELMRKLEMMTVTVKQANEPASVEPQKNTTPTHVQTPDNVQTPAIDQDEITLKQTIAKLYAQDPTTRGNAILQLKQSRTFHEKMVPLALRYALERPTEKNGVVNTFLVLQRCDPKILKKNKDDVNRLAELVKKVDGSKANAAESMKVSINQP